MGQWRFDDGSGTLVRDSSGSNLNGRASGGPDGVGPAWVTGVSGSAMRFDGDDAVALPDSPKLEPAHISVAAWVRGSGSPGSYRYILSKGSASCLRSSYGLYTAQRGSAGFYVASATSYTVSPQPSPAAVWDGRWHRLVGTYDGHHVRLYLDGRQVGHGAEGPSKINYGLTSTAAYIGTYHGDCDLPFTGDIDTVEVYDAALSDGDVAADAGLPGRPVPPSVPGTHGGSFPVPAPTHPGAPAPAGATVNAGRTVKAGCLRLTALPRRVHVGRRTRIRATVRIRGRRRAHVRLWLRGHRLRATTLTGRRGGGSFRVRPTRTQRRLTLQARSTNAMSCATTAKLVIHVAQPLTRRLR